MIRTNHAIFGIAAAALLFIADSAMASPLLKQIEQEFINLSDNLRPSVVEISVTGTSEAGPSPFEDMFRFFDQDGEAPNNEERQRRPSQGMGSGFIFDAAGHIITNNHVVEDSDTITVRLHDGSEREATLVGRDPSADIAVVKIDPSGLDLNVLELGNSSQLKVGQYAIAMGSPRGLTDSVSFGHISALGREELRLPDPELRFQNFIQTDAPINLGNSGGPLCNIDGEAIGVNVAIAYGANSIGFAIPIDIVKEIVPQIIKNGRVIRGWLGVSILNVDEAASQAGQETENYVEAFGLPDASGAAVAAVTRGGPAEAAGLEADDVIRTIASNPIDDKNDLVKTVSSYAPGTVVAVEVFREGKLLTLSAELGEFPDIQTAQFGTAYLGMRVLETPDNAREILNLTDDTPQGVLVGQVVTGSPAEAAGVRAGDFVVKVAHQEVQGVDSFVALIDEHAEAGKTLLVTVIRRGRNLERLFVEVPEDYTSPN